MPPQKHFRSNSCDIKITRSNSNSKDTDVDYRLRKFRKSHSRNNSKDYEFLNNQMNQSSTANSAQGPSVNSNIKYIVNHFKNTNLNSSFNLNNNFKNRRRHIRNHSYGQEFSFLPNNAIIRLDNDLANKFLLSTSGNNSKHHSRKNSYDSYNAANVVDINLLAKKLNNQKYLENNEDLLLNEEEFDEEATTPVTTLPSSTDSVPDPIPITTTNATILITNDSVLRHRRTNSKDLQQSEMPLPLPIENPLQISESSAPNDHLVNVDSDGTGTTNL